MSRSRPSNLSAFEPHDHGLCRRNALRTADATCRAKRLRLTPARAFVLETLLETHRAMTAYEVLDRLRAAGLGAQPPVAYRALEFLVENGFAHRIERLGAFVACSRAGEAHLAAFVICRDCRKVAETAVETPAPGLTREAAEAGFTVERMVIEAEGLCAPCREAAV